MVVKSKSKINPNPPYICPDCQYEAANYASLLKHRVKYCTKTSWKEKNKLEEYSRLISCDITKITFKGVDLSKKHKFKPKIVGNSPKMDKPELKSTPKSTASKPVRIELEPKEKLTPQQKAALTRAKKKAMRRERSLKAMETRKKRAMAQKKKNQELAKIEAEKKALEQAPKKLKSHRIDTKKEEVDIPREKMGFFQKLKLEVWEFIKIQYPKFNFNFSQIRRDLGIEGSDRSGVSFLNKALKHLVNDGILRKNNLGKYTLIQKFDLKDLKELVK